MKKIIFAILTLVCILLAFLFLRNKPEKPAPVPAVGKYILTYSAGENGTIEGTSTQVVKLGGDGSPVTAVPLEHYHFTGWSDGVATATRTDHKVTKNLSVKANFAIDSYTLAYEAAEGGEISGSESQKVAYGGSGSTVKAVPTDGYHFLAWSDGLETPARTDSDVTGDLSVTAEFTLNQYTLTYTAGENGTIKGVSPQSVTHGTDGNPVTAVPAAHFHFTGWSDGVATATRTDRKVTADLSVTAQFAIDRYTLTYMATENGSISGSSLQSVVYGGTGSAVKAVPAVGYHFVAWSDGVKAIERTDSKVTANLAVTATFAINRYTLTYEAGDNGNIVGDSSQTVDYGGAGSTVTAVAEKGYHFVAWSDGITTAQRSDSKVQGDMTVSALFAVNTYAIGGNVSGLVPGTKLVLQNNGGDDLVIAANGSFKFSSELLNEKSYEVKVLTQPNTPNQECTVSGGRGTVSEAEVTGISVKCVILTYKVGGKVSGLRGGNQIELRNNGRDNLVVSANGTFAFATPLKDGNAYEVSISRQPKSPNLICKAENTAGTLQGEDVTDVGINCFPKPVLKSKAGKRKIELSWNTGDFKEGTFDLCIAREEIASGGFANCKALAGGALKIGVSGPLVVSNLSLDTPYWFQLAHKANGRQILSEVIIGMPFGGLNDTGIDWCADNDFNRYQEGNLAQKSKGCTAVAANFPGQDADYGRDAAAMAKKLEKTGSGAAGFDFTKVCRSGDNAGEKKCPPKPLPGKGLNNWACTRDNTTGLLWEVKEDNGLGGKANTYSWFNPDAKVNGGEPGMRNGGDCEGSDCDTRAYIKAINKLNLCGVSDWRLPTRRELLSIVDNSRLNPAIDTGFFPNTLSTHYWTSSPTVDQKNSAWQVYFRFGEAGSDNKAQRNSIRLVHGRTVTFGLDNP